jgi:chromosome segregation ATPase
MAKIKASDTENEYESDSEYENEVSSIITGKHKTFDEDNTYFSDFVDEDITNSPEHKQTMDSMYFSKLNDKIEGLENTIIALENQIEKESKEVNERKELAISKIQKQCTMELSEELENHKKLSKQNSMEQQMYWENLNENFQSKIFQLEEKIQNFEKFLEEFENEKKILEIENSEYIVKIKTIGEEKEKIEKEKENLSKLMDNIEPENKKLVIKNETLEQALKESNQAREEIQSTIETVTAENNALKEHILKSKEEYEIKITDCFEENDELKILHESELSIYFEDKVALEKDIKALDENIKGLEADNRRAKEDNRRIEEQLETCNKKQKRFSTLINSYSKNQQDKKIEDTTFHDGFGWN